MKADAQTNSDRLNGGTPKPAGDDVPSVDVKTPTPSKNNKAPAHAAGDDGIARLGRKVAEIELALDSAASVGDLREVRKEIAESLASFVDLNTRVSSFATARELGKVRDYLAQVEANVAPTAAKVHDIALAAGREGAKMENAAAAVRTDAQVAALRQELMTAATVGQRELDVLKAAAAAAVAGKDWSWEKSLLGPVQYRHVAGAVVVGGLSAGAAAALQASGVIVMTPLGWVLTVVGGMLAGAAIVQVFDIGVKSDTSHGAPALRH